MFYKFKVIKYRNPFAAFAILLPILASLVGLGLYANALVSTSTSSKVALEVLILLAFGFIVLLALCVPLILFLLQWHAGNKNSAKGYQSLFYTYSLFSIASLLMFFSSILVWGFSWNILLIVIYQIVAAALNYAAMKYTGSGFDKELHKDTINVVKTSYQRFEKHD